MSPQHLASRRFPSDMLNVVLDDDTGELMEYRHLMKKQKVSHPLRELLRQEIGRLAQGMPGQVTGTNKIFFVNKKGVPADRWRDVTYGRVVVNFRPEKGGSILNAPHYWRRSHQLPL